jgi:hypothetical protein
VIVLGEYTATCTEISTHSIDRGGRNEGRGFAGCGVELSAGTVEQEHIVLAEVSLAVPKASRGIEVWTSPHLTAAVGILRLIVQVDRARAAWNGKLGRINAYPAKQALQALGNG